MIVTHKKIKQQSTGWKKHLHPVKKLPTTFIHLVHNILLFMTFPYINLIPGAVLLNLNIIHFVASPLIDPLNLFLKPSKQKLSRIIILKYVSTLLIWSALYVPPTYYNYFSYLQNWGISFFHLWLAWYLHNMEIYNYLPLLYPSYNLV